MKDIIALLAIKPDQLPEPYRGLFDVFLEHVDEGTAMKLIVSTAKHLGGDQPYFGSVSRIISEVRSDAIIADFTGYNLRELAQKYGLTVRTVRRIVMKRPSPKGVEQGPSKAQ